MKKLIMVLAASLLFGGVLLAHGYGYRNFRGDNDEAWRQMDKWRDIMHDIDVDTKKIDNGVTITIETDSTDIAKELKTSLNSEELAKYFEDTNVKVKESGKDVIVTITSDDKKVVEKLQYYRRGLIFQFLRDQMMGSFDGGRGYYGHMGPGYRSGCYGGYGPGMMGGSSNNWGPGFRHMNWDGERINGTTDNRVKF